MCCNTLHFAHGVSVNDNQFCYIVDDLIFPSDSE